MPQRSSFPAGGKCLRSGTLVRQFIWKRDYIRRSTSRPVILMTKQLKQHINRDEQKPTERKPFEVPVLRREAGLTEVTAERTFTFATAS